MPPPNLGEPVEGAVITVPRHFNDGRSARRAQGCRVALAGLFRGAPYLK